MHPTLIRVRRLRELSFFPELPFERVHFRSIRCAACTVWISANCEAEIDDHESILASSQSQSSRNYMQPFPPAQSSLDCSIAKCDRFYKRPSASHTRSWTFLFDTHACSGKSLEVGEEWSSDGTPHSKFLSFLRAQVRVTVNLRPKSSVSANP